MIIGKRILTTHAGSLPRPPQLVELYARRTTAQGSARGRRPRSVTSPLTSTRSSLSRGIVKPDVERGGAVSEPADRDQINSRGNDGRSGGWSNPA